jgi:hypothetical protein
MHPTAVAAIGITCEALFSVARYWKQTGSGQEIFSTCKKNKHFFALAQRTHFLDQAE